MSDLDFAVFSKKMPWDKRLTEIQKMFPSTTRLDWSRVFHSDPTLMGRIISDMAKMEQESSGKPGKRPSLSSEDTAQYYRKYQNDDYSMFEFKDAFKVLKGNRSFRAMAHKCDLSHGMVQRLLNGTADPTPEIMEKVAKAFKKHPSYFLEYRVNYVTSMIFHMMMEYPETSVVQYNKLKV